MTNLVEAPAEWIDGIYQLETNDPVMGGADGIDNLQAKQLAKRTAYLKEQVEAAQGGLTAHEAAADPHPVYLTSAEGDAKVAAAVAALVASSPAALDTLNELAAALGNDANFAATITNALAGKANLEQLHGRNVIVNGCCSVSQLNGSAEITPVGNSYPIDNVQYSLSQASKLKCDQTASLMGALGAVWSLRTTVLAKYTPIATDVLNLHFPIEGLNFARFKYGTANAKAGSLQFKALPSVAGTYSGCIANYAGTRSYPFSFAVTADDIAAGGKLVKVENIPGDTGGAWVGATNAGAAEIRFDLGCGANFKGAAGAWVAGDVRGVTGALAFVDQVNGSTLAITDVQFEVGAFGSQFERKPYDYVEMECQRYLPTIKSTGSSSCIGMGSSYSTTQALAHVEFKVTARVAPTGLFISSAPHFNIFNLSNTVTNNPSSVAFSQSSQNSADFNMVGTYASAGQPLRLMFSDAGGLLYFTGAQI